MDHLYEILMAFLQVLLVISLCDAVQATVVTTANGKVQGTAMSYYENNLFLFRGIPYAKPPIGPLRFQKPEPVVDWAPATLSTKAFKPACIQPTDLPPVTEPYRKHPTQFDEDCLYLNIWAPKGASNRPVFVWIHGGGYYMGSATINLYSGEFIADSHKVLVVTVNYRLGPLGFSYFSSGTRKYPEIAGNMGLWDQRMAMTWIKKNIKAFGGDPNLITLFGQGTGAASVGFHILSAPSHDLFNTAILQSGSPTASWVYNDAETAKENLRKLGKSIGCRASDDKLLDCLFKTNPQTLADQQFSVETKGLPFVPVVDNDFLLHDPVIMMQLGMFKNTSVIHGVVKDEATLMLLPRLLKVLEVTNPPTSVTLTEEQYNILLHDILRTQKIPLNATILSKYYVNGERITVDYLSALNNLWSDIDYKCPAVEFASYYSKFNPLYQYSYNYRRSNSPYPPYVGVAHSHEIEMVFGTALVPSNGFKAEEMALSKNLMKYLVNFGTSSDPNKPKAVGFTWPLHQASKNYLLTGKKVSVQSGLRHRQCVFVKQILPEFGSSESGASENIVSRLALISLLFPMLM